MAVTPQDYMTPDGLYSGGVPIRGTKIDMSPILSAILKTDTAFLGSIGGPTGAKAHNIQIEWLEDQLNAMAFTANFTYADDASDPMVVSDPATTALLKLIFRAGAIIQPQGTNYLYQVDAAEVFGDLTIEITAYNGMGAGGNGADGSRVWEVISKPFVHGADASDDISRARDEKKNFLETFESAVGIDEIREKIDMHAVSDDVKLQAGYRMKELHNELNIACLRSYSHASGVQTDRPTMKGIRQQIEDYGNTNTYKDAGSSATLTETIINNLIEALWDEGGLGQDSRPHLLVNSFQHRQISAFDEAIRRTVPSNKRAGAWTTEIQTDIGPVLKVVLDRHMPKDSICLYDATRVNLRHLQGLSFYMKPLAVTGMRKSWEIAGVYSLEVRNAGQAHGWVYDLSTS